jgi:hypothetical protein
MPINFQSQKQNLKNILEENLDSNPQIPQVARQITSWYDSLVKSGQDQLYGNGVVQANPAGLQTALTGAFSSAFGNTTASAYQTISTAFQTGVITYWTGAILEFAVPPPPSIQVTSNQVTSPGTFNYTLPEESESIDIFIDGLIQSIRAHFRTVSGVTTSLTPQPTGAPVPVPYPWTGYV